MSTEIQDLQAQIAELEGQLEQKHLQMRQHKANYKLEGRDVIFDETTKLEHEAQRSDMFRYWRNMTFRTRTSGWFVYFMIIPFAFMDLSVTIFQAVCFWAWNVPKAKRADYVFIDRQHLKYLNGLERFNCLFCGYANGVAAFTMEVTARTEKHWCPIKHASKVPLKHPYYADFMDYGDAKAWKEHDDVV